MRFDELNDDNYLLFAIKYYENPLAATMEDFQNDMRRFKYIKRLLKKYLVQGGELKYHLILNHLIICFNIFDEGAVPLLFYKIDQEYWSILKTFLLFLNRIPEYPKSGLDDLEIDQEVYDILNSI
jgi:membrane-bound lytic murein transglycosylase MltF|tara:strand:- start:127 stop:501 length:375 start_codon:yes stop_codon:yes gene_type:complete